MEFPTIVIALAGATCSGKTTLSERLLTTSNDHTIIIHQDDFYKDDQSVPYDANGMQLWDDPCSINWDKLIQQIKAISLYPYTHCNTCNKELKCSPLQHTVIVEGTMLLHSRELSGLCHKCFFITLDYETCNQRRKIAYDQEDKPGFFDKHVWPMYCAMEKIVTTQLNHTVTIINGAKSLEEIESEINSHLSVNSYR